MVLMSAIRAANTETGSTGSCSVYFSSVSEGLMLIPTADIIIICCIAGLIIALLLGAIITWFVRARRRTNRSGSPQLAALPRRNQAQGIVRAMLNTLPIVKFDDTDDGVKTAKRNGAKRDVEMSLGTQNLAREHSPAGLECIADNVQPNPSRSEIFITNQPSDRPTPTVPGLRTDTTPNGGNFSCPICTDDFVKSQDLRILPCNHQFHLGCIDPWLVNVSGTCPLW